MLYTKYESYRPSSFREEEFLSLPSLFLCSNLRPRAPGLGQFRPQKHHTVWDKKIFKKFPSLSLFEIRDPTKLELSLNVIIPLNSSLSQNRLMSQECKISDWRVF